MDAIYFVQLYLIRWDEGRVPEAAEFLATEQMELDGEDTPLGEIWGNAGLFEIQHTWDYVRITNYSTRNLVTNLIDVVDGGAVVDVRVDNIPGPTGSPGDGTSIDEDTVPGETFELDFDHTFPETQVEIQNLNPARRHPTSRSTGTSTTRSGARS